MSPIQEGRTTETKIFVGYYKGDSNRKIRIIDTQGFNDPGSSDNPTSSYNQQIITDIMKKLTEVDHVDLFLICLKGNINRVTNSLHYMLKLFRDIFGQKLDNEGKCSSDPSIFWNRCVIVFTHLHMGKSDVKRRLREQNELTDEQLAVRNVDDLACYFDLKEIRLEHIFIDSFYETDDQVEKERFDKSLEKLHQMLLNKSKHPAMTKAMLMAYHDFKTG